WDKETFDAAMKASRAENELMQPDADQKPSADRETIAAQAQLLLTGKEVWKPKWEDVGEPEEVEKELEFSNTTQLG
ncbi:mitochondrial 54S ribosomal protein YmL41, partial [Cryomyces antarcticus]